MISENYITLEAPFLAGWGEIAGLLGVGSGESIWKRGKGLSEGGVRGDTGSPLMDGLLGI